MRRIFTVVIEESVSSMLSPDFSKRQPHTKNHALFRVRMERDLSFMGLHDLFHNTQAQAGPSLFC